MTIGFAGLSHLGIVSGIAVASKGFEVLGYDASAELVADLNKGKLPIFEPDLDDLLKNSKKNIRFSSSLDDLAKCEVVVISLDVRTTDENTSDLAPLHELINSVGVKMRQGATLVILSQVPPGFTRQYTWLGVRVYYQVETLIFGRAVERALYPERYMVGCGDPRAVLPTDYEKLLKAFGCPILPMKYESAELAKICINAFLAASVSTTNTLAELCEKLGADWREIAPSLKLDKRIGPHAYLAPGLGISGGNIERDLATLCSLSSEWGTDADVIRSYVSNSKYRKNWVVRALHERVLARKPDATIAIWGLAYKPGTKSVKNSPCLELLQGLRGVKIRIYDPQATLPETAKTASITQVASADEACKGADALVIMTEWDEFKKMSAPQVKEIIDPYGVLGPKTMQLGVSHAKA